MFNTAEAFLNFTAMSSKAEINNEIVRNEEIPAIISSGGIYAQRAGFDLTILGKYISSYKSTRFVESTKENPAQPQPLGDFFTMDLTAGWSFGKIYRTRIYLEIVNITDRLYSTVVGYPDFGRRFTLGIRLGF